MLEVRSSVQLHVFACGAWHFHKTVARSALTGPRTHGLRRIIQFTMIDRDQRDFGLTLAPMQPRRSAKDSNAHSAARF